MDHKLYYKDPYIKKFTATVLRQNTNETGEHYVVLSQTAFYPTGGGQPYDTGTLDSIEVTNVEEIDGEIRHYLTTALPDTYAEVVGIINWERRFDHMQQHTGQHILSAAFEQLLDAETVGFHMGREMVTIDVATDDLTQEQANDVEDLANRIVYENRPVNARFVEREELAVLPLRKPSSVTENIRLVTVQDFDYNPCGGTHPLHTGEVGPIKILSWERYKGHVRLQFICGLRALRALREKHLILRELSRQLSSSETELPMQVERLLTGQRELERNLRDANEQILEMEVERLLKTGKQEADVHFITAIFTNRSMQDLQKLARLITQRDAKVLVLLVTEDGERVQFVCACGEHIGLAMNDLAKAVLPYINGKGGGNPKMAQGGGSTDKSAADVLAHLIEISKKKM